LTKTPIMHSRTKHIKIRHHFLREHISNGNCEITVIGIEKQLADLFAESLARDRLNYLIIELVIINLSQFS